ncbi:MAG: hypothetical protein MJ219_00515 [Mycoplasmoidaceae bacterium]|nr:hypothetical protein [Mycoplasmoidaceae bacterium]
MDFTQYEVEPTPYPVLESQEFFIDETAIYKLNIDLSCTKGDLNYYHYGELSWINHQYIPVDVNVEILNYVCDGRKLSFDPESEIPDKEDTYCYNEVMYDCIAMYQDSLTKTSKIEIELIFIDSSEITELVQFGFVNLGPSSNITAYA